MTRPSDATATHAAPTAPLTAARSVRAWILFAAAALVGLAADLASKTAAFAWLERTAPATGSRIILPGVLRFTRSTNPGVVFGVDWIPDALVILFTLVAIAVVIYFFAVSPRRAPWMHAALAMILGGALGNLVDRATIGRVRDFIDFSPWRVGPLNYPWVFNIADVLLVVGVGILMILSLMEWRRERLASRDGAG
ncbi:MAG: signal peptidase II [Planctomycetes bacterium]|nr:signal peptidase II [Planctomycetota bacterium]